MTITPKELVELKSSPTPMQLLENAVSKGANVETLERLLALQERWEKNQARKSFDNAMAAAKADMPIIFKNREVDFTSQRGRTNYQYEDLAGIAREVEPVLAKNGLSYRYRTSNNASSVTVTCVVSHRDGHSEENSLSAGFDISGNKNSIQAIGSTVTYLQRYTLKAALGLSASTDNDATLADKRDKKKTKIVTSAEKPTDLPSNESVYQDPQAEAPADTAGDSPSPNVPELPAGLSQPAQMYAAQLDKAAEQGMVVLNDLWGKLHPRYQKELAHRKAEWKATATAADAKKGKKEKTLV